MLCSPRKTGGAGAGIGETAVPLLNTKSGSGAKKVCMIKGRPSGRP